MKGRAFAGFFDACANQNGETGLAGWGARIRTAKFPFLKRPLKFREKYW
jgi:hypothetical protein